MSNPPLALRFFPSLTDFAFVLPIGILFGLSNGAHGMLADGDTGWHIRVGEWMLRSGRVPDRDIFSFTKPGQPWFAWEWLWDVVFGWIHQRWGLAGVVLVNVIVLCLISAIVYRLVRSKCANDFVAFAVTVLAMAVSSMHWLARPHVLSLLFVLISYCVLERARSGRTRALMILPLLTAVWANLHGGFAAVFLLIGAYAGGELMSWLTGTPFKTALAAARPYLLSAAACLLASLLNPYGYQLHLHIFRYLADPFYTQYISEFGAIDFRDTGSLLFEGMMLLGSMAAFRSLRNRDFVHPLLFVGWCHLALTSARYIPIFAVVAAPMIGQTVGELVSGLTGVHVHDWIRRTVDALERNTAEFAKTDRVERFHVFSILAILVTAALLQSPQAPPKFRAEFDPRSFPARALPMVSGPEYARSVFSTDSWGGYLIYRLFPATATFIDGRSDFYGPQFVKDYLDVLTVKDGWEQRLNRFGVSTILIGSKTALAGALKQSVRWRNVHDDGVAIVFRKAG